MSKDANLTHCLGVAIWLLSLVRRPTIDERVDPPHFDRLANGKVLVISMERMPSYGHKVLCPRKQTVLYY